MKNNVIKIIETSNKKIIDLLNEDCGIYTFLNPVSYLIARKNKTLYYQFDGILSDGGLLQICINYFYRGKIDRYSFDMTSCAPIVFNYAVDNKKTVYLIGSDDTSINKTVTLLNERYPGISIIGYRNGFFSSEKDSTKAVENIVSLNPDIVIVGMGVIVQEEFLLKLRLNGFGKIGFTCGGFFHQLNECGLEYYPYWINKLNLRFLYRMFKEKHTRKRYIKAALLFPVIFIYDKFCSGN